MKSEKFLELYKEYEGLLRLQGFDPKDVEDKSEGPDGDRLRMCRLFRNYFAHVADPGFLEAGDKMQKFLEARVQALKLQGDVVRKHLKKPEACMVSENAKCSEAFEKFTKLGCMSLPVIMSDGTYKALSVFNTVGAKGSSKISSLKLTAVKPVFCGPLGGYMTLDTGRMTLCTEDGTPSGKLLGRVWFTDRGEIMI